MQFKAKSKADPNVIRLKDGESVTGVFRGEPVEYYQHRTPDGQYVQAVQGEMMNGKKPQFRFRLNLCVRGENGGFEAKVFENGWKVYEQLAALQESGYDLETTVIRLSRKGSTVSDTVCLYLMSCLAMIILLAWGQLS